MSDQNFEMFRSDTRTLTPTVKDRATGLVIDLTGATIIWKLAKTSNSSNSVLISKSTTSGIAVAAPTTGVCVITINPTDTASITPGDYYHEMRVTDAAGRVVTVMTGRARIKQDLT